MNRGKFITLEGGEGVGKSTCMAFVLDELAQLGVEALATREPGGTALGETLRGVLLDPTIGAISDSAELLLMFAARAEHITQVIEPALATGQWVISDRFTDATYAYQGGGRHVDAERIAAIEHWVQGDLQADLTFLLDAPIETGLHRAARRGALDRFEQEGRHFFENVRQTYLQRAQCFAQRFRVIDASQGIESVEVAIRTQVKHLVHGEGIQ